MRISVVFLVAFLMTSCGENEPQEIPLNRSIEENQEGPVSSTSIVVLGNVQDAGSPHAACQKDCCKNLFEHPDPQRMVVSLGLIDTENQKTFLFEATTDLPRQMRLLKDFSPFKAAEIPDGIFLTHAHIGHYSGLMYLGKESCNADKVNVYAMPRMKSFLENNGPWNQLVSMRNIAVKELENESMVRLSEQLEVIPISVPHRDEYSETVGYIIKGPNKSALFIPDIDKWDRWSEDITEMIQKVDYAFLDATFYDGKELNTRDISQIPHPFVVESMEVFKNLPATEKAKIHFIHFNHTNALLDPGSNQTKKVTENGFNIARFGDRFEL